MTSMNVLAIYAVNEHLAELMAEAHAARLARKPRSQGRIRSFVTSRFGGRGSGQTPVRNALANS